MSSKPKNTEKSKNVKYETGVWGSPPERPKTAVVKKVRKPEAKKLVEIS